MVHLLLVMLVLARLAFAQDFRVSETGHAHFAPSIAADSSGGFVVVWSDGRNSIENGGPDSGTAIYAQRFAHDATPMDSNFRVSETALGGGHRVPSINMTTSGDFVVVWHGPSSGIWGDADIYARRFRNNGTPLGSSFKVSDDTGTSAQIDAKVLVRANESFIITWLDRREGPLFSYAQLYDSTGTAVGSNFRVNQNGVTGIANLGGFEDGRFFFMWARYLHLYRADGSPDPRIVNIGKDGHAIGIGVDSLLVFWTPFPQYNIFLRLYDTQGFALTDSFKVDQDDPIDNPIGRVTTSRSKTGEVVIAWEDHRNDFPGVHADGDVYAQRFDRWATPIGANFKVNHEPEERYQRDPTTVFSGNNFITAWLEDQTPERCPPLPPGVVAQEGVANIMATIQPFDNPTPGAVFGWRTKRSKCPPPSQFALYQNYPNPFNSETTIAFDIPQDGLVDLTVYDLLGRTVQRVVHSLFRAGRYRATFRTSELSSGVYFYRLSTDRFAETGKMTLVK